MITADVWYDNVIDTVNYGAVYPVKFVGTTVYGNSDLLEFNLGSRSVRVSYPHVHDNNTVIVGGNEYAVIAKILKPLVTNTGIGRNKRVVIFNMFMTPIELYVTRKVNFVSCKYGLKFWYRGIPEADMTCFRDLTISREERSWLNSKSGYTGSEMYITTSDIQFAFSLFMQPKVEWNWKHINDLRVYDIEKSFLSYMSARMSTFVHPNMDQAAIQRIVNKFWRTTPQLQWLDPNISAVGRLAATQKVHYPINRFSKLEEAVPDQSTVGILDFVSTPQSDKAGEVISLVDGVRVQNGKFVKD